MELDFYKLHLCGNDAVLLNHLYSKLPDREQLSRAARAMCPRRTGVGANSIIVAHRGAGAGIGMVHLTQRGSEARIHNDGALCLARFAFDSGFADGNRVEVDAPDISHAIDVIDSESFRISLGTPKTLDGEREVLEEPDTDSNQFVEIDGQRHVATPLRVQRPFMVVLSTLKGSSVRDLTRSMRRSLPSVRALPVFLRVISREEIRVHSWQPALLQDCTSTVAAAAAAGILNGFCDNDVVVNYKGHTLFVQWVQQTNRLLVTASPRYVYSGSFHLADPEERE